MENTVIEVSGKVFHKRKIFLTVIWELARNLVTYYHEKRSKIFCNVSHICHTV